MTLPHFTNSPTLPAPASASARLQSIPHTSVGDVADATIPNPTCPSRVSVKLAAPKVPRGAAVFSSNPDRGYMGRRLNPALGISVVSRSEAIDITVLRKQPSMASRLTPPRLRDSFHSAISVVPHGAHRVLAHPLPVAHFSSNCVSAHSDARDSDNCNDNQIDNHFEISNRMIGVNTF